MDEQTLLARIDDLLAGGLTTEWRRRAYDSESVNAVTARLQSTSRDDIERRLVIGGFTATPYVDPDDANGMEQSCATCMYFERHRSWCNLDELQLPVKAAWSCILWRI